MNETSHDSGPQLFLLDQNGKRRRQVHFNGTTLRVGREPGSDLVLEGLGESRRHAVLWLEGTRIYVEDLGSTAGTKVNGALLRDPHVLGVGDIVTFASARLEVVGPPDSPKRQEGNVPSRENPHTGNRSRFNVRDQRAESISMVGGNQYNVHVLEERRHLLLEVAAAKTRARWILLSGFLVMVVGVAVFGASIIRFFIAISDSADTGEVPDRFSDLFGVEIFGIPSGLLGWAMAGIGMLLMLVGSVLHLVAMGRRKRMERDLPLPSHHET